MKNTFWGVFVFAFLTVTLSIPGGMARAANPSISSFSVSPLSVGNGQPINISWTLGDAGGHGLLFSCQQAVVIRDINGTVLPCGSKISVSSQASDATTIIVSNVSGVLKQISVTLTPKDGAGTYYDPVAQTQTITVGANQNTITSFTVATSTPSNATTTISWVGGTDVPATNVIVGCTTSDISAVALAIGPQFLPCGTVISSTDLSASGSLDLLFVNKSSLDVSVPITIIPAIVAGSYDATHGNTLSILVRGAKKIEPVVTSFTASPAKILSDGTAILSWATENASGVNIKFSCNENVSVAKIVNQATTTVACGNFIFNQPSVGTNATVALTNMTYSSRTVTASILPANADGTYSGLQQKDLNITVLGMGVSTLPTSTETVVPVIAVPVATTTATASGAGCAPGHLFSTITGQVCPTVATAPATTTAQPVSSTKKFTFIKPLSRGMVGAEVRALQQFFANYPETYGNVTVNGVFGPATEKLVMKFQERHSVAKKGAAGYGYVGPATRAKLNSLQ